MVIEELATVFDDGIRGRGAAYVRKGAVTLWRGTQASIEAQVKGTRPYFVALRARDGNLVLSCNCQYFADRGPCKHLWATALAADAQGRLETLPECANVELADSGEIWAVRQAPAGARGAGGQHGKGPRPSWQLLLHEGARASAPPTAERSGAAAPAGAQLLYVVEAARTQETGHLIVSLRIRQPRKQGGGFTKDKRPTVGLDALEQIAGEHDRRALPLLRAAAALAEGDGHGYYATHGDWRRGAPTETAVPVALAGELLPRLQETGRLFVRASEDDDASDERASTLVEGRYDDGGPWDFVMRLARPPGPDAGTLTGVLRRGDEETELAAPLALTPSGWVVFPDRVARLNHHGAPGLLHHLRRHREIRIPRDDERAFLEGLYGLPALPRLDLPDDLAMQEEPMAPQPTVRVGAPKQRYGETRSNAELSFTYGKENVPWTDERAVLADLDGRRLIRRDLPGEAAATKRFQHFGFRRQIDYSSKRGEDTFDILSDRLGQAVRGMVTAGWRVEADGKHYRQAARLELSVTSGVDWFDLAAVVDFGDGITTTFPELLRALRDGASMVVLGDGSFGMVPEAWVRRYQLLADLGTKEADSLRFRPAQVGLLDALLAAEPAVTADRVFEKARAELRSFTGVAPQLAPAGFEGELRPYQEAGLGWLDFLRRFGFGGCLADDMGLGKTIQVLAMLAARARGRDPRSKLKGKGKGQGKEKGKQEGTQDQALPSLVVVPKSLVWNWQQEAARFVPGLRVLAHVGSERAGDHEAFRRAAARADLIVTTYGVLRKDILFLREVELDYAILDEAQAIKNAASESAKAARLLRARHRLALSGTPIENHIGELWSLIEFLNPGMLGSARALGELAGSKRPDPETLAMLGRALRPFILRRTKEQVAPELPPKHEETIFCEMEVEQRRLYDELRAHYRASLLGRATNEGLGKLKIQILEALLRLRQAACHPGLIDRERAPERSGKLDVLLARLEEVRREGHKALVFSQFTSFLAIVRARLDAERVTYEYLDGKTRDRQARVERFQTDADCSLFLISLKAGGVGLNLTAADYVFILDPWWNPAVEAQAVDRAHRIGQDKHVFVYRLLCRDSVEEKVAALQDKKRDLAAAIIDDADGGSLLKRLDRETLELLLE